jgi:hypothetical protein
MKSNFCLLQVYSNGFKRPVKFVETEAEAREWVARKTAQVGRAGVFEYEATNIDKHLHGPFPA